ncbi:Site-specific recombinase XerD [Desulfuromusa kysingii]|uniref:Site-specific recombinase XerD n=1 Tax=Desulfuromusa kysingii TaxID=37625 RepID=A0A1H3VFM1_9BACT|nr:site-specific integrase [Desulfuromusa kysingii]SDZ73471.1 Site-specific recombinase XerD [Desulfuromusa kysingii]
MASINKRGPYQWQVKIRRRGWPKQAKTFATYEDAARWARKIESKMDDGVFVSRKEAETTTLDEALDRYLREKTPHKKGAAQETNRINLFKRSNLASRFLSTIRSTDIAKYRDQRLEAGKSPYTVNNELILLSSLFNVAHREWDMESIDNPVSKVSRPKLPSGRDRRLEPGEEEKLLGALGITLRPLFQLALETALRQSELLALEWKYINLARQVAHLPETKNGEARNIPLSSHAVLVLKKLPRRLDGKVFGVTGGHVSRTFRETCETLKIENLHWHDLRHEACSRLFEKGLNPMEVASISGHKTLQMLKRYTHLKAENLAAKLG